MDRDSMWMNYLRQSFSVTAAKPGLQEQMPVSQLLQIFSHCVFWPEQSAAFWQLSPKLTVIHGYIVATRINFKVAVVQRYIIKYNNRIYIPECFKA